MANNADNTNETINSGPPGAGEQTERPRRSRRRRRRGGATNQPATAATEASSTQGETQPPRDRGNRRQTDRQPRTSERQGGEAPGSGNDRRGRRPPLPNSGRRP
ncbi:MAG: hypothetical protein M3464_19620, partial [Chloroflexota bacterium]|nr:hypothetical protein [Chloroflexota bacterium]